MVLGHHNRANAVPGWVPGWLPGWIPGWVPGWVPKAGFSLKSIPESNKSIPYIVYQIPAVISRKKHSHIYVNIHILFINTLAI